MAYEKTNWQTGDVVTSAKLNKIEDGIANVGEVFKVTFTFVSNSFQVPIKSPKLRKY